MSSAAHSTGSQPNGHFHVPKWVLPLAVTWFLAQNGTNLVGTLKQADAAQAASKTVDTSAELAKTVAEHNKKTDEAMQWMNQQLMAINRRVTALEKDKKP